MSSIYIQEPPTKGKVLIETSCGDIDIELWAREAPKACRNFVQLCMEGYYDGTIFHRVVKGFIVQGGDPTGTGTGGESIYGQPFKDEFHSRLRFVRRGLVAMANAGKDDNGSQFFFTMGTSPELQNKHTIFGKVAGNTLYNMLKLEDSLVDQNDKPLYPNKIIATKVLSNPYNDIVPRVKVAREIVEPVVTKKKSKATKNFKLLSFGDEAEEDEEETNIVAQEYRGKSKSSHDLAHDPRLSSVPAVDTEENPKAEEEAVESDDSETKRRKAEDVERVQKKLKTGEKRSAHSATTSKKKGDVSAKLITSDELHGDEETREKRRKYEEVQNEIKQIKKELTGKKNKDEPGSTSQQVGDEIKTESEPRDEAVEEYRNMMKKYVDTKVQQKADKASKEQKTLAMLEKFRTKLNSAKDEADKNEKIKENAELEEGERADEDEGWWTHTLCFADNERLAKDANLKNEDTYDISDPRHPINLRRREASKKSMTEKKHK